MSRMFQRRGGLVFFRVGRFGGSVYLARARAEDRPGYAEITWDLQLALCAIMIACAAIGG